MPVLQGCRGIGRWLWRDLGSRVEGSSSVGGLGGLGVGEG